MRTGPSGCPDRSLGVLGGVVVDQLEALSPEMSGVVWLSGLECSSLMGCWSLVSWSSQAGIQVLLVLHCEGESWYSVLPACGILLGLLHHFVIYRIYMNYKCKSQGVVGSWYLFQDDSSKVQVVQV